MSNVAEYTARSMINPAHRRHRTTRMILGADGRYRRPDPEGAKVLAWLRSEPESTATGSLAARRGR